MKIVFFGTPDYVLPILAGIHKKFVTGPGKSPIVAVVTQSPKPTGRKQILTYSPIDKWAHERKIPIYYSAAEFLKDNIDAELGILAAYGEILPNEIINYFPQGILNIHPSLLPKFRGASPIQGALVADGITTGVSIIKMDAALDHGPIISQFKEDIIPEDTGETLRARLFERAKDVLLELLEPYRQGKITPRVQDDALATFTVTIKKEHGFIKPEYLESALKGEAFDEKWEIPFIKDYSEFPSPAQIDRFIRAMKPWPVAWTLSQNRRLKILKAHIDDGKLVIDEVQMEGKTPVTWKQFRENYSL